MVQIDYREHSFAVKSGETVLDALLRNGIAVSFSCRAGSCHTCMLRAVSGTVPEEAQRGLRDDLRERGYFLPCKCRPNHSLAIQQPDPRHLSSEALVADKHWVGEDVAVIRLEAGPDIAPRAGQFIRVVHPDGSVRPYSVASLPSRDYFVELHVKRLPNGKVSRWLVDEVMAGDTVTVMPPAGNLVHRHPASRENLLLLATGTGLAPLLPILREALARDDYGTIWLLHGASTPVGLYADHQLRDLEAAHAGFHYRGCCSREAGANHYPGRVTAHITDAVGDLSGFTVFAAGHPAMVAEAQSICIEQGLCADSAFRAETFESAHSQRPSDQVEEVAENGGRRVPPPDPELWSQLENGKVLSEVLRDFYEIAFNDEYLGPYFRGVTQQRLREKQYSFLRSLILGTRDYFGQRPANAHHWMVISDWLFDYRLKLMESCLRDHGVSEPWIQRWHVFEEYYRTDIVKDTPVPRLMAGRAVETRNVEDEILTEGAACDRCDRAIAAGTRVRFHLQLGRVYCGECVTDADDAH